MSQTQWFNDVPTNGYYTLVTVNSTTCSTTTTVFANDTRISASIADIRLMNYDNQLNSILVLPSLALQQSESNQKITDKNQNMVTPQLSCTEGRVGKNLHYHSNCHRSQWSTTNSKQLLHDHVIIHPLSNQRFQINSNINHHHLNKDCMDNIQGDQLALRSTTNDDQFDYLSYFSHEKGSDHTMRPFPYPHSHNYERNRDNNDDDDKKSKLGDELINFKLELETLQYQAVHSTIKLHPIDTRTSIDTLTSPNSHDSSSVVAWTSKRLFDDRERLLLQKNTELNSNVSHLESRCEYLAKEMSSLKRQLGSSNHNRQNYLEDKLARLKIRNSKLVQIANDLQETISKNGDDGYFQQCMQLKEELKKKDDEINKLRVNQPANGPEVGSSNIHQGSKNIQQSGRSIEELETIIRQLTKEKLQLQKHMTESPGNLARVAELEEKSSKYEALLLTNEMLKSEIKRLEETKPPATDEQLLQKLKSYEELERKHSALENDMVQLKSESEQIKLENASLNRNVAELQKVEMRCEKLRQDLKKSLDDCDKSRSECIALKRRISELEISIAGLSLTANQKKQLENDYNITKLKLNERQQEMQKLHMNQLQDRDRYREEISKLENQLRSLRDKNELSERRCKRLSKELQHYHKNGLIMENSNQLNGANSDYVSLQDKIKGLAASSDDDDLFDRHYRRRRSYYYNDIFATDSSSDETYGSRRKSRQKNGPRQQTLPKLPAIEDSDAYAMADLSVFVAKYDYNPMETSPNKQPEFELPFKANEYVIAYGNTNISGYYNAELLSGRRGLAPSNYLRRVTAGSTYGTGLEALSETNSSLVSINNPENKLDQLQTGDPAIASPINVRIERHFIDSVLLRWQAADLPPDKVTAYAVYVNGSLRSEINKNEKMKALVGGLDNNHVTRLSVRTITPIGHSSDAQATVLIGKDLSIAPSQIKVLSYSATTAVIAWMPSDSNFSHTIFVNNDKFQQVPPGTNQCNLTGLEPTSTVTVKIMATGQLPDEHAKMYNLDKITYSEIQFQTDQQGIPDSPASVRLDTGSEKGSLYITWLPVTISANGKSNGTLVTGYTIYINGRKILTTPDPTADYLEISPKVVESILHGSSPYSVTVRTQSIRGESRSSAETIISNELINTLMSDLKVRYNGEKELLSPLSDKSRSRSNEKGEIGFQQLNNRPDRSSTSISGKGDRSPRASMDSITNAKWKETTARVLKLLSHNKTERKYSDDISDLRKTKLEDDVNRRRSIASANVTASVLAKIWQKRAAAKKNESSSPLWVNTSTHSGKDDKSMSKFKTTPNNKFNDIREKIYQVKIFQDGRTKSKFNEGKDRQDINADDHHGISDLLPVKNSDSRRHSSYIDTNGLNNTMEIRKAHYNRRFSAGTTENTDQSIDAGKSSLGMAMKYLKKQNHEYQKKSPTTEIPLENSTEGDTSSYLVANTGPSRSKKTKTVTGNMQGGSDSDLESQSESDERHVELFKPIEAPPGNSSNLVAPKPVKPTPCVTPIIQSENDDESSTHESQLGLANREAINITGSKVVKGKETSMELVLGKIKKLDKNSDGVTSSPISTPTNSLKTTRPKKDKHLTKHKPSELYLSSSDSDSDEPKPRHTRKASSTSKVKELGAEGLEEKIPKIKVDKLDGNSKKSAFSSARKPHLDNTKSKAKDINSDSKKFQSNDIEDTIAINSIRVNSEDSSPVVAKTVISDTKSDDSKIKAKNVVTYLKNSINRNSTSSSSSSSSDSSNNNSENETNEVKVAQSNLSTQKDQQSKRNLIEYNKSIDTDIQSKLVNASTRNYQEVTSQQIDTEKTNVRQIDDNKTTSKVPSTTEAVAVIRNDLQKDANKNNDQKKTIVTPTDAESLSNNKIHDTNVSSKSVHIAKHKPLSATNSEDSISKTLENLNVKDNDVSLTDESEFAFDDEQFDNFEETTQPFTPTALIDIPEGNEDESESMEEAQAKNKVRLFVALYNYDPEVMSPNPLDVAEEELPFKQGDIIKIYGDKDGDGFYKGELNNRTGYVPCNMVCEIQYPETQVTGTENTDPDPSQSLSKDKDQEFIADSDIPTVDVEFTMTNDVQLNEEQAAGAGNDQSASDDSSSSSFDEDNVSFTSARTQEVKSYAVALYDYDPYVSSPNADSEMELTFHAGDTIRILGNMDEDGYFMGELNDKRGLVPSNFVKLIENSADEGKENDKSEYPAKDDEGGQPAKESRYRMPSQDSQSEDDQEFIDNGNNRKKKKSPLSGKFSGLIILFLANDIRTQPTRQLTKYYIN
ncbi:uncharacterized protein TRIADDRAFT_59211 [Trichoplax adhaerens]|uniref:SH3 domain-containing protein n=1 Tax=Trichoplax adhaerens TaxID=10228 RepID=B3S564_TRIAD|nr:hypothetical protein TRIADDRAFT_59211 [Trichoplax adhaerens]EDV22210.1 hypothetical protein TRIADDRAFT_59211 [Trichoplax adhaerens]|eukprot:XP_002115365.1 hypothetical protein TRIADDRAFT_59211 [Trichoplax adhaerens]